MTDWGPSGQLVYDRTYSRKKPDGTNEVWEETVARVARGNLALVHGDDVNEWPKAARDELRDLIQHMTDFRIIPADTLPTDLTPATRQRMQQAIATEELFLGNYNKMGPFK